MKKTIAVMLAAMCILGIFPARAETAAPVDMVDLTKLSTTMVYAEVYNMLASPKSYVGRTIRMRGPYSVSFYEPTGLNYHFVIVEDAAACCQQGLEFEWIGEHSYPEDYPEPGAHIEVTGVFEGYEELGQTYYHIVAQEMTVVE